MLRAAWRRKWIAAAVLLMGVDVSVAYYRLKPAVYRVEAILAQRPQAAPPARSEAARAAPAPSAWEMVHRRENLLALIGETSLLGPSAAPPAGADPRERRRTASDPGADPALTLARRLDHAIRVVVDEDTITVAIEWPNPDQAYRLVKVAVDRLLEARRAQVTETVDEVVKPAEPPRRPVSPDPFWVFGFGTLASLLLAVGVAATSELRSAGPAGRGRAGKGASLRARGERGGPGQAIVRGAGGGGESGNRGFQELWFALARMSWRSLVLVPADEGESVAAVAASLADVGRRLRREPVTFFILADPIGYGSAAKIMSAFDSRRQGSSELAPASAGQVIVAIQPVISEPLGLAVTEAADVAVVCVEMGRTRLAAARRTIDLIGRERVAGCLVIH